jgi:hypothetical protein
MAVGDIFREDEVGGGGQRAVVEVQTTASGKKAYAVAALAAGTGGGGGDASATNQTAQIAQETLINTRLGDVTAPAAGSVNYRLAALLTAMGSPLQAGATVNSAQSGAWNITNITGSISLPTGAALDASVTAMSAKLPATLGIKTSALSMSIAPASDAVFAVTAAQATASNLNAQVQGPGAAAATPVGNPNRIAARGNSAAPTAVTAGQASELWCLLNGQMAVTLVDSAGQITITNAQNADAVSVVNKGPVTQAFMMGYNGASWDRAPGNTNGLLTQPFALAPNRWSYAAATGGIVNTTTAVTIAAAAGAGLRNYLASIEIDNDVLGAAVEIAVRDGAAGTVLWRGKLQTAAQSGRSHTFATPLKGTANTLMEFVVLTAVTGGVYFNGHGFTGA